MQFLHRLPRIYNDSGDDLELMLKSRTKQHNYQ
jgi:hypothetical protein